MMSPQANTNNITITMPASSHNCSNKEGTCASRDHIECNGNAPISKNSIDLSENLEFWMTRLPLKLQTLPIIQLAIPGSHNSMTYTIEPGNDIGPDETPSIQMLGRCLSILMRPIVFNWSVNQEISVREQLDGGIRYLDLRVAVKTSEDKIYFLHGLYGAEISQPLQDVADWLSTHPNEIIILDFQHFYKFNYQHHASLIEFIKQVFGRKLCPVFNKLDHLSLQWLNKEAYQVFVIYRNIAARNYNYLWPSGAWSTPWPNTVNTSTLVNFLNESLQARNPRIGYVSQCLLTPNAAYVIKHICGNLHRDLCPKCRKVTLSWIKKHAPGNGGMNIVITDFVSLDNFIFSKTVIQRNMQLLYPDISCNN
ncbi:hypothetical protein TKK_0006355 [Trichogramma kaykai]|uniref:Phosphatidylinositol-specific phospholipase C X domain-containing protein n=1 Tax=Trichogramma kaykai TaxID=54128 RepID=A0ABD2XE20_9HYME